MKYNYCVWLPLNSKKVKGFTSYRKAEKYMKKQKQEAYINSKVGTLHEDTIKGNGKGE